MDLAKVLADCIEWAEATCDNEFTAKEFFDMLEIPGKDFAFAAMLEQITEQGFFKR